jgi:L-fuconolactonase
MSRAEALRVDSHQHFWRLARGDYDWLTPNLTALYRDFGPEDLRPLLAAAKIDRTILIQAAPTIAETRYLLEISDSADFVAGVVGWIDMDANDALDSLERLRAHRKFKGVRPMIQDIVDPDWMLRRSLSGVFDALVDLDLSFDALVLPQHLPNLRTLLGRHPGLRVVIDHGAKPRIGDAAMQPWRDHIRALAQETSAHCKLSGLVTEAGDRGSAADLQPYVDCLLESFDAERLMWGSDWPVLLLRDDYAGWLAKAKRMLAGAPDRDIEEIFGLTACRFYGIGLESGE